MSPPSACLYVSSSPIQSGLSTPHLTPLPILVHPESRCPRPQRLPGAHDAFVLFLLLASSVFLLPFSFLRCVGLSVGGFHELSASKAVLPLGLLYLQTPLSLCVE